MPDLGHFSHLFYLAAFNLLMLAILWARNGRWLITQWRILVAVSALAVVWTLFTDPIGGRWGAWYFNAEKVLGIWLFGVTPLEDLIGMGLIGLVAASAVLVFGYSPRRFV